MPLAAEKICIRSVQLLQHAFALKLQATNPSILQRLQTLGVQAIEPPGNGLVHLIFSSGELPRTLAAHLAV